MEGACKWRRSQRPLPSEGRAGGSESSPCKCPLGVRGGGALDGRPAGHNAAARPCWDAVSLWTSLLPRERAACGRDAAS